jgi:hypothetical protein
LQVVTQRLLKLQTKGTPSHMPAWVHIKRRKKNKKGQPFWEVVHAKGHLDEVQALSKPNPTGTSERTRHLLLSSVHRHECGVPQQRVCQHGFTCPQS